MRFLTANGQRDTHTLTLQSGRANPSRRAGTRYGTLSWDDVATLVANPAAMPKDRARLVILSSYVEHDARTHAVQRQRGVFHGLAVDVDAGNLAMDTVAAAVAAATGGALTFIFSSSSAAPDHRKWRALVPLATPVSGADYHDTSLALYGLLEAHGVTADVALARPAQPVFLPNVPPHRRGPDGRPLFYEWCRTGGAVLELHAGHAIVVAREELRAKRAADEQAARERAADARAKRLAHVAATGDTFNVVEHFNAHHRVADLLARYGFERGRADNWRSPISTSGSFSTMDCGTYWVTVSAWAHNTNVGHTSRNGNRHGDAWDLFVAFEHHGDKRAAARAYAAEVRPHATTVWAPAVVDDAPAPGRVEEIPARPTASLDAIRDTVAEQLAGVLEERPPLAVLTAGTGGSKTTTAVRLVAATPGRVLWNVATHAQAAAVVDMHTAAGHTDVAAMPPRDETTCRCYRRDDVQRVAAAHGVRPGPSMEQAMAVGAPHAACVRCPLWPQFKRPAGAPAPDADLAAWAPVDDAALADAFAAPWAAGDATTSVAAEPPAAGGCRYWQLVAEAERARIVVQCQARTERRPDAVATVAGEQLTVVTDENAMAVLRPRRITLVDELQAVANVLRAAAHNRGRRREHRSHAAHVRAMAMPTWLSAMAVVADQLVALANHHAAAEVRAVLEVPDMTVDMDHPPHNAVAAAVALESLPKVWRAEAMDLVWRAATGGHHGAQLYVEPDGGGTWHGSFHRSWNLQLPPGTCHVVLDATADVDALRRVRPDAVVLEPPGTAPTAHLAVQWWAEINNRTHPAVVVDWLERVLDAYGWQRVAVFLPKRHRKVLFPQTAPRRGHPADLPVDVEAVAAWNDGRRELAADDGRRLAAAHALAERVARLRARIAVDANGNALVDHHRGPRARGSNEFMAGACDGVVALGHVRVPTYQLGSYLMSTGQADAAGVDGAWGWVEGDVATVDGGTRTVRWRGYADERWAAAARALNRADLEQLHARARANLPGPDGGVPLVAVAAEPCGLPVADPPERLPAGVAAVVEAVRRLVAGPAPGGTGAAEGPTLTGGGGNPGKVGNFAPTPMDADVAGESCQRCTGSTPSPISVHGWHDSPRVTTAAILAAVGAPKRSTLRWLADAVARGLLSRHGAARATTYGLPGPPAEVVGPPPAAAPLELATGLAADATVVVPMATGGVGDVGGHLQGVPPTLVVAVAEKGLSPSDKPLSAGAPPALVTPAPYPRDANAPETVTGPSGAPRETADNTVVAADVGAKTEPIDSISPAAPPAERFTNMSGHNAKPPPRPRRTARGPTGPAVPAAAPAPADDTTVVTPPATGHVGATSVDGGKPPPYRLPDNAPRLTGAARTAMVEKLRTRLRAVAWAARLDKLQGNDRDDLAVAELVALFGDAPAGTARGP